MMGTVKALGVHGISQAEVDRIIAENSVNEFWKLDGVPGYCLETLPWQEASKLVQCGTFEALGTLGRDPADIVVYRRFKAKVNAIVYYGQASAGIFALRPGRCGY